MLVISFSQNAIACGNMFKVTDCDTPSKALQAISKDNERLLIDNFEDKDRTDLFEYNRDSIEVKDLKLVDVNRGDYMHLKFTMVADNPTYTTTKSINKFNSPKMEVEVHYYKSIAKTGKRPAIIAFPTILKMDMAEPLFARFMAKKGISVFVPEVESIVDLDVPLSEVDNIMRRSIVKGRMLIDLAETEFSGEINTKKIGTWGLSLGGVRAANLIGIDRRVTAAVIVSAGGNNADIFTYSDQEYVTNFRNKKLSEEGYNNKQTYFSTIRQSSNVDPIYFAKNVPTEQIFMIMARDDSLIPTRNQLELWEALGRPGPNDKNWKRGQHKSPIIQYLIVPWFKRRILKFYTERFNGID